MKNKYIENWKNSIEIIVNAKCLLDENLKKEEEIKKYAKKQLEKIEEYRPNKEKTAKEQANKEQKEVLIYLEKVAETGKL